MRVEVEKIQDRLIEIEEDVSVAQWDLDSFDIHFLDTIHIRCAFIRKEKEIIVDTQTQTRCLIICSRCLEKREQNFIQAFHFSYNLASVGNYLDMDKDIREQILLNYPMKVLCHPQCKGLCPYCGVNLNYQSCQCKK